MKRLLLFISTIAVVFSSCKVREYSDSTYVVHNNTTNAIFFYYSPENGMQTVVCDTITAGESYTILKTDKQQDAVSSPATTFSRYCAVGAFGDTLCMASAADGNIGAAWVMTDEIETVSKNETYKHVRYTLKVEGKNEPQPKPQTLEELLIASKDFYGKPYQDVVAKLVKDGWTIQTEEEYLYEGGAYSKQYEDVEILLAWENNAETGKIAALNMNIVAMTKESVFGHYIKLVEKLGPVSQVGDVMVPFELGYIGGIRDEWEYPTYDEYLNGLTTIDVRTMEVTEAVYESEIAGIYLMCYSGDTNVEDIEHVMMLEIFNEQEMDYAPRRERKKTI